MGLARFNVTVGLTPDLHHFGAIHEYPTTEHMWLNMAMFWFIFNTSCVCIGMPTNWVGCGSVSNFLPSFVMISGAELCRA